MAKDRNGSFREEDKKEEEDWREESKRDMHRKSKRKKDECSRDGGSSDSEDDRKKKKKERRSQSSRRRRQDSSVSEEGSSSYDSYTDSGSEVSDSGDELGTESEQELRRRKKKERRRREREHEKERKRRKEREKEKKRKRDKEQKRRKKADKDKSKKNKEKVLGKTGAVTNSWGKYGIIRETDMWNKRPEFTAWLAEVKKVNLESLSNWEEKQMFKEFMEDHNTATFPSKKYYDLDAYHKRKMEKEMKEGYKKVAVTERTVFNDEEQRRQELLRAREKQKEEQVEALKLNMQSGMAQAMKEQARLREEMVYQYRLGNLEAAAAIQKRLDPDAAT